MIVLHIVLIIGYVGNQIGTQKSKISLIEE